MIIEMRKRRSAKELQSYNFVRDPEATSALVMVCQFEGDEGVESINIFLQKRI